MKIVVITGSPHRNGTSALLADRFIQGAMETGHDVFRFNAAFEDIHPCLGCDHCGLGVSKCVQDDAMVKLNLYLIQADLVVFVTPLYYFGMSAQIKRVIDRFYANDYKLTSNRKDAILMVTASQSGNWAMNGVVAHYETLLKYLDWRNYGMILARGCNIRSDIEHSPYPERAYKLGKNLRQTPQ